MSWQEGTFEVSTLRSPQKRMIVMNAALQTGIGKLCKLRNCPPPRFGDRASDSEFTRKLVVDVHTGEQYHKFMLASPRDRLVRDRFQKLALDLLPAGAAVLDFGAGTGIDAKTYAANGHRTFVHEPGSDVRVPGAVLPRNRPQDHHHGGVAAHLHGAGSHGGPIAAGEERRLRKCNAPVHHRLHC